MLHEKSSVSLSQCRLFLRELRGRQIDTTAALRALRRTDFDIEQSEARIAWSDYLHFVSLCEELAGDPSFGLRAGQRVQLDDLGLFGLLLRASSDGHEMYDLLRRFERRSERRLDVEIAVSDATLQVRYRPPTQVGANGRVLSECALARALSLARMMLGPWLKPARVELAFAEPNDTERHQAFFGCPLSFSATESVLTFPSTLLATRAPHRDPAGRRVLERHLTRAAEVAASGALDVVGQVRDTLCEQLASGDVTLSHVACALGLSERTLRRQLQQAGTSYQALLDDQRRRLTLDYRQLHPSGPSVQLSDALGFSDPAAFRRAYKRWTGARWSDHQLGQAGARDLARPGSRRVGSQVTRSEAGTERTFDAWPQAGKGG
ncbi:MAG: putative AraC family transcriptional regulator [Myxococcaceae bacterium]|nr:putative AraC family transcriptional regulator [Myxococcaceae bacterium]